MALIPYNSCNRILSIFVSCLAFHLFCSTKSFLTKAKPDLIDDICSHVPADPEFCKTAFRSVRRSSTADLQTLAQIGIDLAQSHAESSVTLLNSLKKTASDPKLNGIYDSCLEAYNETSDNLKDCTSALKEKDHSTLNVRASAALDGPVNCDDSFGKPPPPEAEQLKQSNKRVQALCSSIAYIANKL